MRTVLWASIAVAALVMTLSAPGGDVKTNLGPSHFLLGDSFGNAVSVGTNQVHTALRPSTTNALRRQIPSVPRGTRLADEIRERIAESKSDQETLRWFPVTPPILSPYLGNLDEFGNTAIQWGAVFPSDPISRMAQAGKYTLSDAGLRYGLWQSLTMVSMTGVASGSSALQYYLATLEAKWALYEAPHGGPASWLSTEANVQLGLSPASRAESPQENLGVIANPNATIFGPNHGWLSELAWQQSLARGKVVVLAGLVDQSNYFDANNYANNSQGQFMNAALVNSQVLPLVYNNLGLNVQWQPKDSWYLMFGSGANNQAPGTSPFVNLSFNNWSYLLECGWTPMDVFGMGPGTYRVQPFVASVGAQTQAGLGFNMGQRLGKESPFAYFGRFGFGGTQVTLNGAATQVATGLTMQAPLKHAGIFPKLSNDYLGAGFIWSQPSAALKPAAHANEFGLETTYVLQLTPLASIQPDFQVIWNPANNPSADHNFIFQLQVNLTW